jgi:uncharacterized protein YfaS (alpha-2-macroglobulin family)
VRRTPSAFQRSVAATSCVAFLSMSCGGKQPSRGPQRAPAGGDMALIQTDNLPPGLEVRLSDGRQGPPATDRATLAPARKIADSEAEGLFARMRAIAAEGGDQKAFALRDRSQPPPRTGQTIKGSFPPPVTAGPPPADSSAGKALEVLRWAPEGEVPIAPHLAITFSQPMIAVTSHADVAADVPVTLSPQPKGTWRWLGTRTLMFDPDVRFPQATTYKITVPAGVKSATGASLGAAKSFTFTTPAPRVIASSPTGGPTQLEPGIFVLFDQKVDAERVLPHVALTAGTDRVDVRLLTADEIGKDAAVKAQVDSAKTAEQDGRWIAVRPVKPLPTDTEIAVTIGAGTPSAEGPNPTTAAQSFSFRTYPPLRIVRAECGWNKECPPGTPFVIELNNPLDGKRWDPALISIAPDVPGLRVNQNGGWINLQGMTRANTRYTVTLSGGIVDDFGQTLGKDAELSFQVGHAVPNFFAPSGMVVLDPAARRPTLDVFATNYESVKVQLYRVAPADWNGFSYYLRNQWNRKKPPALPGKKVVDQLVKTGGTKDELTEVAIDLAPALGKGGLGHVVAVVEPHPWKEDYEPPRSVVWIQATRIGLDAFVDASELVAWATRLGDGAPLSGVALEIAPFGIKASSDDKGTARLPLGTAGKKGAHQLLARQGDDVAFVLDEQSWWDDSGSWVRQQRGDDLRWYLSDDRRMYKPGETLRLKGWLRKVGMAEGGDVAGIAGMVSSVGYTVIGPMGNELGKGTAKVSALGGFDLAFTLPKTPNLGYAHIQLEAKGRIGGGASHGFQIQEFRRPEFEVSATASQGPHKVGESADVTASARYYAGGGLPSAPVTWEVSSSQTTYTPPNRDDFTFGIWRPWWGYRGWFDRPEQPQRSWTHRGTTDATGAHVLHLDFLSANPAVPMSVSAQASVMDVNRQAWTSTAALIVHPSDRYVGVRAKKAFVDKGQPIELDVIGVDIDGKATVGAPIRVRAVRLDWAFEKGEYVTKEVDAQDCDVMAAADAVPCSLVTKEGGTYQVTATIVDERGRPNQTKLTIWVSGGDSPPAREVTQEEVTLVPDQKDYRGGETAELLVQAPFYPAEGILSVRRSGLVEMQRFSMTGPTTKVKVPIVDGYVPNVHVQIDLVGGARRIDDAGRPVDSLPRRPAYASGSIDLPVPPRARTLDVKVAPSAAKLAPGEKARIDVTVKGADGKPVSGAEVAVIVVDEAILALTSHQFANPLDVFYAMRSGDVRDHHMRAHVKLARPDAGQLAQGQGGVTGGAVAESASADMASGAPPPPPSPMAPAAEAADGRQMMRAAKSAPGGAANQAQAPIAIRSNFDPLAAFAPAVTTGAGGKASVEVTMPDNLTRYRVVALAVAGEKAFGKGESAVTARLPLMVRPSPPRFLNFGDTFQLPVVVQNQTDAPMTVTLGVRASNAAITDGRGRTVTVPANDRVEVRFPAAAEMPGTARFQVVGAAGKATDAAELALPVWTPATTEAFATYGVIDEGAIKQLVSLPGKVVEAFGGLEVETSSTQLQALTDAFLYLVAYPYECSEQLSSRILAVVALRDVLTAFQAEGLPAPAAIETRVAADLERLESMQNGDGGFPIWSRGRESWPYLSVHTAHALVRAKAKGYKVSDEMLESAKRYLRDIERRYPSYYGPEIRRVITSYALFVRNLAGDRDLPRVQGLLKEAGGADKLPLEAAGWLLATIAGDADAAAERKALVRHLDNKAVETAGAAHWSTSYQDGGHLLLQSDRRADGVVLDALIDEQRGSDLIPKVVAGLLAHKKRGRWENTQDNVFVLLALDKYFHTYEKATPDFVARVWLGQGYAGEHAFKGRTTDRHAIDIPMAEVAKLKKGDLTIQKDGKGRLYYRIGMTYAPADLSLPPADHGFVVERVYEAVDAPGDVVRQPDGSWKIKAGARVRIRLTMVAESRRYHVALVDPLPAGLEAMNPALAVTGTIPQDPKAQGGAGKRYWWWSSTWYEHQNLRDERAEAFASLLWEGVHEYTYVARATTPGRYVVPPPKAEEMYMPETFGRGASDRVIVE